MKQIKRTPLSSMHPDIPRPLSQKKQREEDAAGRDEQEELEKPPKNLPQRMMMSRREVERIVAKYKAEFRRVMEKEGRKNPEFKEAFHSHPIRLLTIENEVKQAHLRNVDEKVFRKPLRNLVPHIKKFDWRWYYIVPKFRKQEGSTCWAYVATQAFESNLMIQLRNYAIDVTEGFRQRGDQVALNVNSTLDRVPPFRGSDGGRHEEAFNHYLEEGIPLKEIKFNDLTKRDRRLEPLPNRRRKTINAIAWDWVLSKPWRTPREPEDITKIKAALLEHGPLAVMVAFDKRFNSYGRPRKNVKSAPPRTSLRFPPNTVTFKKNKSTGKLLLDIPGLDVKADQEFSHQDTANLVVRFPAEKAPKLETRTGKPIKLRPSDCDDAVTFEFARRGGRAIGNRQLGFTANNGVEIEKDDVTGEVILHFPANTDARFIRDRATGDLIARFPGDKAPVFKTNGEMEANHFVLLIGWDDDRCAWLIQNTFRSWGHQCNRPGEAFDPLTDDFVASADDRGCMYISYGCNKIGQFAAWIEAQISIDHIKSLKGKIWARSFDNLG